MNRFASSPRAFAALWERGREAGRSVALAAAIWAGMAGSAPGQTANVVPPPPKGGIRLVQFVEPGDRPTKLPAPSSISLPPPPVTGGNSLPPAPPAGGPAGGVPVGMEEEQQPGTPASAAPVPPPPGGPQTKEPDLPPPLIKVGSSFQPAAPAVPPAPESAPAPAPEPGKEAPAGPMVGAPLPPPPPAVPVAQPAVEPAAPRAAEAPSKRELPAPAAPLPPLGPVHAREQAAGRLQEQINRTFPDSVVRLTVVGGQVVLSGQARDRAEANAILQLVHQNLPAPCGPAQPCCLGAPSAGGKVVNLLRVPGERQVMLRVTVAEVNRLAARSIGVNFGLCNKVGAAVCNKFTGSYSAGAGVAGSVNNLPMVMDNGQVVAAVSALRSLDLARSLAEPTLVAMDGETASFHAGGQLPVPVVTGATATGLQGVQFVPFGVQLHFTPHISDKDRIRLQMSAEVSTRDLHSVTNIGGAGVTALNTRNFQTVVEMREGQTMAVAGLLQQNLGTDASRVPLLGDVPVLNRVFGHDRTAASEQELVVLVTPELVHPLEPNECPPLPGSDLFEPGDIEFYLLGRLESKRPQDYRSPAQTDLSRMLRYRHCEQLFIYGPSGHSDACNVRP